MSGAKQFTISTLFKAIDEMSAPIKNMSSHVGGLKNDMRGMDKIVKSVFLSISAAAVGATLAIADFTKESAKIERYIARLSTKFNGSMSEAKDLVQDIQLLSAKTPLQFEPLIQAADKLLAYGVAGEDIIKTLRMLGDVAQGDATKLDGIANAYGRILAEDRVTRKRLQPLVTSGVPIYAALSKVMGISQKELSGALQKGEVGASKLNEAIKLLTSEGGMFFNNMEKQASTLLGRISTFNDLIIISKVLLGDIFLPIAKSVMEYLIDSTEKLLGWIKKTFGSTYYVDSFGNSIEIVNTKVFKLQREFMALSTAVKKFINILISAYGWIYKIHTVLKPFYKILGTILGVFLAIYAAMKVYIGIISFYLAIVKANKVLILMIKSFKGFFLIIGKVAIGLKKFVGLIKIAAIGLKGFVVALAANPVGLTVIIIVAVIAAIVGLIFAFKKLYKENDKFKNFIDSVGMAIKDFLSKIVNFKDQILVNILAPFEAILGLLAKLPGKAGEAMKEVQGKVKDIRANTEATIITRAENEKSKNGKVDVSFGNAPKGTKVNSTAGDILGNVALSTGSAYTGSAY